MATAINFFFEIKSKVSKSKIYDFNFTDLSGTSGAYQFAHDGQRAFVRREGDADWARSIDIFRDKMTVRDAIALLFERAGVVTSGGVYRCDILNDIHEDYEKNEIYTGIHNPTHEFSTNRPTREAPYFIGFELETVCRTSTVRGAVRAFSSNIWRQVTDGSIGSGNSEFVSTLLHPEDAIKTAFYDNFLTQLTGLCISKNSSLTGLHCHISRDAYGSTDEEQDENISKLIYLENYILNQSALARLYGRNTDGSYTQPNEDRLSIASHVAALAPYNPRIIDGLKDAFKASFLRANKTRSGHDYGVDRYHRINITNQHTIEFRQGKGDINSKALAVIAQHAIISARFVSSVPWHKLTAANYYNFIPNTNKYALLKSIFAPIAD